MAVKEMLFVLFLLLFLFLFLFTIFAMFIFKLGFYKNSSLTGSTNGVSDCCLTPNEQFFRYIMASLPMEDGDYPNTFLASFIV